MVRNFIGTPNWKRRGRAYAIYNNVFLFSNIIKEGYRGVSGGNVRGTVNPSYEVAAPLDEITHDFGLRTARSFKSGNVYATFNRNLYVNQAGPLMIDNPFQAFDAAVVSGLGGPAADRFSNAPDNEASTGTAGFLLKFKRQTRVSGSLALSSRTQDAQFYPYTANSAVLTTAGVPAFLHPLPKDTDDSRLTFARWLVDKKSPTTGRGFMREIAS